MEKWLNVILDLNGVLCVSEDLRFVTREGRTFEVPLEIVVENVGLKKVALCPQCLTFLRELSSISYLSIWSSKKRSNVLPIAEHLFQGIEPSFLVLVQEQCAIMKCKNNRGKLVTYKVNGTEKDLLLKPIERLYNLEDSIFTLENTIVVDDSPAKHFLNFSRNVVLLDSWSYNGDGITDDTLMGDLLPWIRRLHSARPKSLHTWRRDNKFGCRTLAQDFDQAKYDELGEALEVSNALYDEWIAQNLRVVRRFEDSKIFDHRHLDMPSREEEG